MITKLCCHLGIKGCQILAFLTRQKLLICKLDVLTCFLINHRAGKRAAESKLNPLLSIEQGRSSSFNSLHPEVNQDIVFEDVDIVTPGQKMLARKLTMTVPAGKSLLVTGKQKWLIHKLSAINAITIKSHSPLGFTNAV